MVNEQPEALRLAAMIERDTYPLSQFFPVANELRRLHEVEKQRDELYAEVEALKTDAARYRAIRKGLEVDPDNSCIVVSLIDDFGGETLRNEIADAAIDAAIAKAEGQS